MPLCRTLSKTIGISQHGDSKDSFIISIGGTVLVQGTKVNEIRCAVDLSGNQQIEWAEDSAPVTIDGGELKP